jgi:hypothetical protein
VLDGVILDRIGHSLVPEAGNLLAGAVLAGRAVAVALRRFLRFPDRCH